MPPEILIAGGIALAGSPLAAVGYWFAARWRARRRNRDERCGGCDGPLYAPGSFAGPSLVEGVLHCAPCAERLRSRVGIGFGLVGVWAAGVAVLSVGGVAAEGAAFLPIAGLVIGEVVVMGGGTMLLMRRKNRLALRAMEKRGELLPPPV